MAGTKPRRLLKALVLGAVMAASQTLAVPGAAAMVMRPYLQAVTTESVYVLVESDTTQPVTVEYGTTAAYGSKAVTESIEPTDTVPATYVHNIKLTGLQPNTEYNYRAIQGEVASPNHTFLTAVESGTGFRFAWMADTRTQPAIHDGIAGLIKEKRPRFSLYGGDLCERAYYEYWKRDFFVPNQMALAAGVPFFNAPGNHEGWTINTKAFTQAPASASGTQDYYSFDYGDAHFLCLNTEIPYEPNSPQWKFATQDLLNTKKTWKVVFFHKPAYSLGGNGETAGMKLMTTYIFEPCKVDVILTGHNHFYQHGLVNGIHHFTIGSAGAPLASPGKGSYVVNAAFDYNFAIADVTPTVLDLTVYSGKGTVLDKLTLTKTEPPPAVDPAALPTPPPPLPPILKPLLLKNGTWKYYAAGQAPDPAWKELSFKDQTWASGSGPLGFGESYIKTKLPAGQKTYYFRKAFSFSGDHHTRFNKLTLSVNYDDGFILYADGQELLRRGLPPGPVTHDTPAVSHEGGKYEVIDLYEALSVIQNMSQGLHVFAVEVHQSDAKDDDLVWDAEIISERPEV
ncbi:MAG: metallophosphoesterase [Bacteroidota bacterium]